MTVRRTLAVVVAAGAVLATAGCTAGPPGPDGRSGSGSSGVLRTTGIRYATVPPGWRDPTLDLYVPGDTGEPPLVVVVPDAATGPQDPVYDALARAVAARGVAAAVVRWGVADPALVTIAGRPVDDVVAQVTEENREVACAVAVAADRAGRGVGSPSRPLLVVGHGDGANAAGMAALTAPGRLPSCFAPGGPPHVAAALLWDGDWLGAVAGDALGDGAGRFLAAYSPWPSVDTMSMTTYVEVGVNANRLQGLAVQATPGSRYLTTRDPSGQLTSDLRAVDAFADGALDPVDVTRAFAVGMGNGEVVNRESELHGAGDPSTLDPRVRALVVDSVVQLTRTAAATSG